MTTIDDHAHSGRWRSLPPSKPPPARHRPALGLRAGTNGFLILPQTASPQGILAMRFLAPGATSRVSPCFRAGGSSESLLGFPPLKSITHEVRPGGANQHHTAGETPPSAHGPGGLECVRRTLWAADLFLVPPVAPARGGRRGRDPDGAHEAGREDAELCLRSSEELARLSQDANPPRLVRLARKPAPQRGGQRRHGGRAPPRDRRGTRRPGPATGQSLRRRASGRSDGPSAPAGSATNLGGL